MSSSKAGSSSRDEHIHPSLPSAHTLRLLSLEDALIQGHAREQMAAVSKSFSPAFTLHNVKASPSCTSSPYRLDVPPSPLPLELGGELSMQPTPAEGMV